MVYRVAIDTNVLIAGVVWPRWPYEVLNHALKNDYVLVLAPRVIEEALDWMQVNRPQHMARLREFLRIAKYELALEPSNEEIAANADLVRQVEDIPIALSVRDAQVDYFVTYDRDFTDDHESTAKVKAAIPGIMLPPVFLRDVMGWTSEELEAIRNRHWTDMVDDA